MALIDVERQAMREEEELKRQREIPIHRPAPETFNPSTTPTRATASPRLRPQAPDRCCPAPKLRIAQPP